MDGVPVGVDDEADGLEEHGVLGVRVLHLLRLGRLLRFVQDRLQTLGQPAAHARILCASSSTVTRSVRAEETQYKPGKTLSNPVSPRKTQSNP